MDDLWVKLLLEGGTTIILAGVLWRIWTDVRKDMQATRTFTQSILEKSLDRENAMTIRFEEAFKESIQAQVEVNGVGESIVESLKTHMEDSRKQSLHIVEVLTGLRDSIQRLCTLIETQSGRSSRSGAE